MQFGFEMELLPVHGSQAQQRKTRAGVKQKISSECFANTWTLLLFMHTEQKQLHLQLPCSSQVLAQQPKFLLRTWAKGPGPQPLQNKELAVL